MSDAKASALTARIVQSTGRLEWEGRLLELGFWVLLYSPRGTPVACCKFPEMAEAESYAHKVAHGRQPQA